MENPKAQKPVPAAYQEEYPLKRPMLSLEKCRAIMNQRGLVYTEAELLLIREFMYRLAEITTSFYDRKKAMEDKEGKTIPITKYKYHDETTSIPLYTGEYRRTG